MRVTGIEVADATHYPLALITVLEPSLHLTIEYAPDAMDHDATERVGRRLASILGAMTGEKIRIRDIDYLDAAERRLVLDEWNDTSHVIADKTLLDLLGADSEIADSEIVDSGIADLADAALTFAGTTISRGEFRSQVNSLARHLVERGVGPESLVAIALHRSAQYVVAVHAVIAAGGAYLPIDPQHPGRADPVRARHRSTVGRPVGRGRRNIAARWGQPRTSRRDRSVPGTPPSGSQTSERLGRVSPDHVAYVIFTSGSTGKPKGVAVSHRAIVNRPAVDAT